ncbi:hypothetical protein OIO90_005648 [Microbotryomycetes sp. JL221]|nr:hypothetical protein OIO90_005648 [Microbotryomycetes sp. JL221]
MKASTSTSTIVRPSSSNKRRSPPTSSVSQQQLAKRRDSPLRDAVRRTPPELMSQAMQRQHVMQLHSTADRDMQALLEVDYREDVKAYMYEMETKTLASVELIDQQPELQWYMRAYVVDFLIEIHQQHRLRPETLYLALNIVDRYVSRRIVFKKHYQLVGCAALWIAAKFEDAKDRVPTVPELCQMCDGAYDESAFIQMEGHVLSTINWVVGHPTSEAWLRLACTTGPVEDQRTQHVARFLMEITLFTRDYIPFKPSELAHASLLLARFMLGKSRRILDESERVWTIIRMLDTYLSTSLNKVSAILVKKYSYPFYSRSSTFVSEWYLSGKHFSYQQWTNPSTPARHALLKSHSPAANQSHAYTSSPASNNSSTYSDASFEFEGPSEPQTPLTPLPPYSTADPYSCSSVAPVPSAIGGKENLTRTKSFKRPGLPSSATANVARHVGHHPHHEQHYALPAHRPPLNSADWDMNSPGVTASAATSTTQTAAPSYHA